MLCWLLPHNNNINPPGFGHFSISWISSLPFIPGATYLCRLLLIVTCHFTVQHFGTKWSFSSSVDGFLLHAFVHAVPLPGMPRSLHLVTSSLRLRLGIISFTVYPTKNELNTCLETLCQVLGNHRCSGFSWAGVFMFHVSRQQEGALEERGCPPPSGSFPRLLVLGWSKHFAVMLPSCSVLCHHGSKPMDWSFLLPVWLH